MRFQSSGSTAAAAETAMQRGQGSPAEPKIRSVHGAGDPKAKGSLSEGLGNQGGGIEQAEVNGSGSSSSSDSPKTKAKPVENRWADGQDPAQAVIATARVISWSSRLFVFAEQQRPGVGPEPPGHNRLNKGLVPQKQNSRISWRVIPPPRLSHGHGTSRLSQAGDLGSADRVETHHDPNRHDPRLSADQNGKEGGCLERSRS